MPVSSSPIDPRSFLTSLFDAAVRAADPLAGIKANLPKQPKGRTIVVGAGKASGEMAAALEQVWDGPLEGAVVVRHGTPVRCKRIRVLAAAHPIPDQAGIAAADELLRLVRGLGEDDLVIALISGGGSSLLPAPAEGLDLADEIAVNAALLRSGAPISAMNCLRKHVSRIKGGRLALAAAPAKVVTFVVSDVPGDNPAIVASGPTIPDGSRASDARDIVAGYRLRLPERVTALLSRADAEAPAPSDPAFARNEVHLVASAGLSLKAAEAAAQAAGVNAFVLSDAIEGEAREIGKMHAALARHVAANGKPFAAPCVILSGGETTVTIGPEGAGKGGRNTEFLLSLALGIEGLGGIHALAADTDGIDGSENNAGAFADGRTSREIRVKGADPAALLAGHDAWTAFNLCNSLFTPGPTGTNVNDFRAILVTG